jgi:hypothetical protein
MSPDIREQSLPHRTQAGVLAIGEGSIYGHSPADPDPFELRPLAVLLQSRWDCATFPTWPTGGC